MMSTCWAMEALQYVEVAVRGCRCMGTETSQSYTRERSSVIGPAPHGARPDHHAVPVAITWGLELGPSAFPYMVRPPPG